MSPLQVLMERQATINSPGDSNSNANTNSRTVRRQSITPKAPPTSANGSVAVANEVDTHLIGSVDNTRSNYVPHCSYRW